VVAAAALTMAGLADDPEVEVVVVRAGEVFVARATHQPSGLFAIARDTAEFVAVWRAKVRLRDRLEAL